MEPKKKKKSSNGKPTVKVGEKEEAGLQPQSESEPARRCMYVKAERLKPDSGPGYVESWVPVGSRGPGDSQSPRNALECGSIDACAQRISSSRRARTGWRPATGCLGTG